MSDGHSSSPEEKASLFDFGSSPDMSVFKTVLDGLHEGVYIVDRKRVIRYWNASAERISGYTATEVLGKNCSSNILKHIDEHGCELCLNGCPLSSAIGDGREHTAEVFLHHKEGHRLPVTVHVRPFLDKEGNVIGAVEEFDETSTRIGLLKIIEHLKEESSTDPLLELPHRRYMQQVLHTGLVNMKNQGRTLGILFFDIDHFKQINDRYGHQVGDEVLKMVSKTIAGNLRTADTLGRWGGDEFVATISHVSEEELAIIADRFRVLVEKSELPTEKGRIHVTVSVGATLAVLSDDVLSLLKRADQLLYQSKAAGRNRVSMGIAVNAAS